MRCAAFFGSPPAGAGMVARQYSVRRVRDGKAIAMKYWVSTPAAVTLPS